MKKIYALLSAIVLTSAGVHAQKTWVGPATGGNWAVASNWSGNAIPVNGDVVVIDGGVSGAINNVPNITLAGLRIEENSTVTFNVLNGGDRNISITGSGNTTRLIIEAGSTLRLEGDNNDDMEITLSRSSAPGNVLGTVDGTIILGQNAVLDWNNGNTQITVTGSIENEDGTVQGATGTLGFAAGSFYRHQRNGGSIPSATWDDASTVEVTGVTTSIPNTNSFSQAFGNLIWNCPNQSQLETFDTDLTNIDGDFTVISTGSGRLSLKENGGGTQSLSIDGDFNLMGGYLYIVEDNGNFNMNVFGNVNISGGTLARGGGTANFVFDNNGPQVFTKTGGTITGAVNFRIDNDAEVDFGTSVLDGTTGNFLLDADAKIIVAHPDGLSSDGNTGAIQAGGTIAYNSGAIFEFRGPRTGTFTTSNGEVLELIINNASGQVLIERNFAVNSTLELLNGYATTSTSNLITIGTGATVSTANGAYVNGPLAKQMNSNASFEFPVGKVAGSGMRFIRIATSGGGGTSTFTAEFWRANPITSIGSGNVYGSGIARVSSCEYWTLDRSGSRNATVTLSWVPGSDCSPTTPYINNLTSLRIARHNGSSWVNEGPAGGATMGSTVMTGEITTSAAVTNFSPFALASSNLADNPLPVLFDGVRAFEKNGGVQIDWSNLTERDIVRYEVERSTNGVDFYAINQQLPKSNRDDEASYTHYDSNPVAGANYYRIRVDEIGGKMVYSKILRVEIGSTRKSGYTVYPNPVVGKQFSVSLSGLQQGVYQLEIYSAGGQRVHQARINNAGSGVTEMVQLPGQLQAGVYVMMISGDGYRESKQLIVK
jgi:hypothetical protein